MLANLAVGERKQLRELRAPRDDTDLPVGTTARPRWKAAYAQRGKDLGQTVDADECRGRIVDSGRHGAQRNVDQFDQAALDVLIACAFRTELEQIAQLVLIDFVTRA